MRNPESAFEWQQRQRDSLLRQFECWAGNEHVAEDGQPADQNSEYLQLVENVRLQGRYLVISFRRPGTDDEEEWAVGIEKLVEAHCGLIRHSTEASDTFELLHALRRAVADVELARDKNGRTQY